MSSSSEEEIDQLLRNRIRRQPRNFEQRRLLDVENPREFRQKFRLPVEAFEHPTGSSGSTIRTQNTAKQGVDGETATISVSSLPWYELILSCYAFVPWNFNFQRFAMS